MVNDLSLGSARADKMGIPVLKKRVSSSHWLISYYEEFESLLFPDSNLHASLQSLINFAEKKAVSKGFRREIVIHEFPFLCAVRPEEKTLYVGTRKISRELALLKLHDFAPVLMDQSIERQFTALKDHIERISTLSPMHFPTEIEWVTFENSLPEFWNKEEWKDVDLESQEILKNLVKRVGSYRSSLFEKFSDYGLGLTAQYDLIRVHLLKFLALLPSLDHDRKGTEVKRNLLEGLRRLLSDSEQLSKSKKRGSRPLPMYLFIIFRIIYEVSSFVPSNLLAIVVRFSVRKMAKRFIAGESISTSHGAMNDLRRSKRDATLDQLGELVVSSKEADLYFEKVLQLIHGMKLHISRGVKSKAGILSAHVSIKVSALSHDFRPHAFDATYAKVAPRLKRILQEAKREEVFINVDAEHYHNRDLVLRIYEKVLLETPELHDFEHTGIVVQAYLRDGVRHFHDVLELAKKRKIRMPIRLVKGAYWDAETIEAEAHQFRPPQFLNKEESDIHFRQLCYLSLKNFEFIHLALASHNLQDHVFVESLRKLRFPQASIVEHQCLHMTYEALSHGLADMGWPTRNYMPIGNLLVGMAYLVRRIMENSSQVGVLSIMRSHQKAAGLVSPVDVHETRKTSNLILHDTTITQLKSDFSPVRPSRLFLDDEREHFVTELSKLEEKIHLSQEDFSESSSKKIICSSAPELILGEFKESTDTEAFNAIEKAEKALSEGWWSKQSLCLYRVSVLLRAADVMLIRRNELAALMVYEAGKTWPEALADVDEAIDFINYYSRSEINLVLQGQKLTNRGVFLAIAPWNFPLAIPCGMVVAPLVAGNAVVLKPAEQTPLIGEKLFEILLEAGVPEGIIQIIQGDGEKVGAPMVTHPRTAGVVFTGSKGVGQWIYRESAGKVLTHYHHQIPIQKKVITEMGGKNAVIVTNNCELDETISGILYGAFGHSGQKCSAASRVIVHSEVKEALLHRLREAVQDLKVGPAFDPATSINPLICEADVVRVKEAVEEAKDEVIRCHGKIIIDRSFEKLPGHCVGPVIFELPLHQAKKRDSWAQREIFGPVIHVMEYTSLIEAVELFNATEYALTGGIYSQSQDDIDFLLKFLRAGNLYVNRPNTGARVAIEPFGGFKLSGTGPKAGGPDYVGQFHFPLLGQEALPFKGLWASHTGYQLQLPRPSLISVTGRIARFDTFSREFLSQYELFMGTVNEKEKGELTDFVDWIRTHLDEYLKGKHLNLIIPGQLSYNDKSLVKEAGLFCMVSAKPSIKSIHYLMAALALGPGVSIACVTQEAFATWKGILDLAWKSGFSRSNLDLALLSPQELDLVLPEASYSFVYAGHLRAYSNELYKNLLEGDALSSNMRLILSEVDGVAMNVPSAILDQFVWIRAIAVNTMRHGAPMEIDV